ncbi:MAG TPA: serine--tRNA ligase [Miltoncostaeaceae bacterium]|nr:serine--tRNA ligase [Miltoncostaeaceae bacterium]
MLDLKVIRSETERVAANLARRGAGATLPELVAADERSRALRVRVEEARAERTRISKAVGAARKAGRDASAEQAEAARLGEALGALEGELRAADEARDVLLAGLPNLAEDAAPDGGEDDAVELRRVGDPPEFPFPVRDHVELATAAGGLDMEAAARVSGARFAYLMGPLVRLQFALVGLALEHLEAAGFTPVIPPVLVREEAMYGTGFFPTDRASIYETAQDDLFLVGTSEVPLAGLHGDQIVAEEGLPLRYGGISTCFRREAGAAGRDTRGIFRVHQFDKVEMFSFVLPEESPAEHQRILGVQEAILQAIDVPYRVIDIAAGDLGASAARKFDTEAWMPGQGAYREVTSCSNCTDYQARRLRTRVRREGGTQPVHTLNGTAVAVGRTIIAVLENHQREDGSVVMPAALVAHGAPAEIRPR